MLQFQIATFAVLLTYVAGTDTCRKPYDPFQECTSQCICPLYVYPVCGTDDQTYTNIYFLKCAQKCGKDVKPRYYGECNKCTTKCLDRCICFLIYKPICGTDGITYMNECKLECSQNCGIKVKKSYDGPCESDINDCISQCVCTDDYTPVCGSNGVTYPNKCKLNCERTCGRNVSLAYNGECSVKNCRAQYVCTENFNPVCASDYNTYSNNCTLFVKQQCEDKSLKFLYNGKCCTCGKGCSCGGKGCGCGGKGCGCGGKDCGCGGKGYGSGGKDCGCVSGSKSCSCGKNCGCSPK